MPELVLKSLEFFNLLVVYATLIYYASSGAQILPNEFVHH